MTVLLLIFCTVTSCGREKEGNNTIPYAVLLGEEPDNLENFPIADVLVIDTQFFSAEQISRLKEKGVGEIYSYLNVGAIENFRDYYDDFYGFTLSDYDNWPEERWIDVSRAEWQQFIVEIGKDLLQKGIDGFFIDNTDIYYLYPEEGMLDGLVTILFGLRTTGKTIIINGGDTFVSAYIRRNNQTSASLFDGVNQESVYTCYDFERETFGQNSDEEKEYLLDYLNSVAEKGYKIYILEYANDAKTAEEALAFSRTKGWQIYISDNIELKINKDIQPIYRSNNE